MFLLQLGDSRGHVLVHPEAIVITTSNHMACHCHLMALWPLSFFSQHGQLDDRVQPLSFLGIAIQQLRRAPYGCIKRTWLPAW